MMDKKFGAARERLVELLTLMKGEASRMKFARSVGVSEKEIADLMRMRINRPKEVTLRKIFSRTIYLDEVLVSFGYESQSELLSKQEAFGYEMSHRDDKIFVLTDVVGLPLAVNSIIALLKNRVKVIVAVIGDEATYKTIKFWLSQMVTLEFSATLTLWWVQDEVTYESLAKAGKAKRFAKKLKN